MAGGTFRAPTTLETVTTHNARYQRDADSQCLVASVPKVRGSLLAKSGDFRAEFAEGGGLLNGMLPLGNLRFS